jgi:hypothetical protein
VRYQVLNDSSSFLEPETPAIWAKIGQYRKMAVDINKTKVLVCDFFDLIDTVETVLNASVY